MTFGKKIKDNTLESVVYVENSDYRNIILFLICCFGLLQHTIHILHTFIKSFVFVLIVTVEFVDIQISHIKATEMGLAKSSECKITEWARLCV